MVGSGGMWKGEVCVCVGVCGWGWWGVGEQWALLTNYDIIRIPVTTDEGREPAGAFYFVLGARGKPLLLESSVNASWRSR